MECGFVGSRWSTTTVSLRAAWHGVRGACSWSHVHWAATMIQGNNNEESKQIVLDRAKFKHHLRLRALRIPKQHSHLVSKTLSRFTLERPKLKHVILDPESTENRLVLLAEQITDTDGLEEKLSELKKVLPVEVVPHEIDLDYRYFSVEQVLKEILPDGWKVPASFETVGHIAHLNLTDELLPYRKVIGEVFLDGEGYTDACFEWLFNERCQKNRPKIKTVVNKVGTISNKFRVPTWEVLAGDTNLVAEVILDMFAGIGPFAIPAAQRGCVVFANDLNPASVQYLEVNAKANKVAGNVSSFNMDAREFMRNLQRRQDTEPTTSERAGDDVNDDSLALEPSLILTNSEVPLIKTGAKSTVNRGQNSKPPKFKQNPRTGKASQSTGIIKADAKPWELFHHVVMNLPASALDFLDVFQGLLSENTWKGPMPRVHCYCFMRASETISDVVKRAECILGGSIQDPDVWTVRDVAPNKIMLCVSFDLSEAVAFRDQGFHKHAMDVDGGALESDLVMPAQSTQIQSKRVKIESQQDPS